MSTTAGFHSDFYAKLFAEDAAVLGSNDPDCASQQAEEPDSAWELFGQEPEEELDSATYLARHYPELAAPC
jgi:hypothetical protein